MNSSFTVIGIAIILYTSGCADHHTEHHQKENNFYVTTPVRKDTAISQAYVAQIKSISHIELRSQERGFLEMIYVDEGQFVKKGQLLFQIMPKLYEAEMLKSKAEARFAEIEYQNTKKLADSNVVAPNELAMAEAKFEKAKAELVLAQVHLSFTEIRAPFDGIIDRFQVRVGSLVDEGDLLTTLSDNSKMWVYFNVPETEYLDYITQVRKDSLMKVTLKMANGKAFAYGGVVETIEADFNNETGNISFRATFPNPKGILRHGETGNIEVAVPLNNTLLIPQKSTFEVLDKKYVFVINDEHVVKSRLITAAAEMPHLFAVATGLSEGDKILLDGIRLVKENDKIEYRLVNADSVITHLNLYAE